MTVTINIQNIESELKSRALDSCRNGVILTDPWLPDNPIIYANQAFELLTGYSQSEFLGKNCRFLQGTDRDQPVISTLRTNIAAGQEFFGLIRNYRKNGELFWNELSITPVYDEAGKLVNFIGVQADVTQRVHLVHELELAKEAAEQTNVEQSKFLACISHDFKTPLNAILGYSKMMELGLAGDMTEKQRHYAEYIQRSGQYLLDLVNDLLDVGALEVGKLILAPKYIDLPPFLAEIKTVLAGLAQQKQVQLQVELPSHLRVIQADPTRLKQILMNLLTNAMKYNHPGGRVTLRISDTLDHQWLRFEVQDTGVGMPEETLAHLFTEYYRGSQPMKGNLEGTGLGLVLVKYLVELHGGKLSVQSKEGQGSTFTFQLPTDLSPALAQAS